MGERVLDRRGADDLRPDRAGRTDRPGWPLPGVLLPQRGQAPGAAVREHGTGPAPPDPAPLRGWRSPVGRDPGELEADPVAQTIRNWGVGEYGWKGTATELYTELIERADEVITRSRAWPATPNALGNKLRRLQPSLRKLGIKITFDRQGHGGTRTITIVWETTVSGVSGVSAHNGIDQLADNDDNTDSKSSAKYNGTSESNQQEREVFTI